MLYWVLCDGPRFSFKHARFLEFAQPRRCRGLVKLAQPSFSILKPFDGATTLNRTTTPLASIRVSYLLWQEHYRNMPVASKETEIYRRDAKLNHNSLTPAEREKLLEVCQCDAICTQNLMFISIAVSARSSYQVFLKARKKEWDPKHQHRPTNGTL